MVCKEESSSTRLKTEPFTTSTWVKQGCVIAPTLFTVYLCALLFLVRHRLPCGVETDYRLDGRLFNLSRLKTKTKVTKTACYRPSVCWWLCHSCQHIRRASDKAWPPYRGISKSRTLHQRKKKQDHIQIRSKQHWRASWASTSFRKLRNPVFDNHNLRTDTNVIASVLMEANTTSIEAIVMQDQLRWDTVPECRKTVSPDKYFLHN